LVVQSVASRYTDYAILAPFGTHGKDNNYTRICNLKFNGTDNLEDIDVDGRILPKEICQED
jgi:hypothetical protein